MRTESWKAHNERLIAEADKVIAESKRILSQIRLREMGQLQLEGWEEANGARIIPFPQRIEIQPIKDLTA